MTDNRELEEKPFRLAAKKIWLTYSQVPEEMTYGDVLESLSKVVQFKNYLIAREVHENGGYHFHVALIARTKFDIKGANTLDLEYKGKRYHGNYDSLRSFANCVEYICKRGNYDTDIGNIVDGKLVDIHRQFEALAHKEGLDIAQLWYITNHPTKAAGGSSVDKLTRLHRQKEQLRVKLKLVDEEPAFHSFKQFNLTPEIVEWIDNNYQPTLILFGEGGTGKTSFVHMVRSVLKKKMLMLTHSEDFKKYNDEIELLFFDDFCFDNMSRQQLFNAFDSTEPRTINVKNGHVTKRKGLIQIVATNPVGIKSIFHKMKNYTADMPAEFARRFIAAEIDSNFIK